MIRWMIAAAVVLGLVAAARLERSPADAKPSVDGGLWQAAGIEPFRSSVPAPVFSLSDLSGKAVDLQRLRGRLVMLYFWATW